MNLVNVYNGEEDGNEITVIEKNESCKELSSGAFVVPAFVRLSENGIIRD